MPPGYKQQFYSVEISVFLNNTQITLVNKICCQSLIQLGINIQMTLHHWNFSLYNFANSLVPGFTPCSHDTISVTQSSSIGFTYLAAQCRTVYFSLMEKPLNLIKQNYIYLITFKENCFQETAVCPMAQSRLSDTTVPANSTLKSFAKTIHLTFPLLLIKSI